MEPDLYVSSVKYRATVAANMKFQEQKQFYLKIHFCYIKTIFSPSHLFPLTRHQFLLSLNYGPLTQFDFFIMLLWKKKSSDPGKFKFTLKNGNTGILKLKKSLF